MPDSRDLDDLHDDVKAVLRLMRERNDFERLLEDFKSGRIKREQLISELAAKFQSGIGSALRTLAEHDKDAAQGAGERLRLRLDTFLGEITGQLGTAGAPPQSTPMSFKDRDDAVLLREYVMTRELCRSDAWVALAQLIDKVRAFSPAVTSAVVTAQLQRLLDRNLIGRERKGKYHATAATRAHLAALTQEIEVRRLPLPQT